MIGQTLHGSPMTQYNPHTVSIAGAIDLIQAGLSAHLITEQDLSNLELSLNQLTDLSLRIPEANFIHLWQLIAKRANNTDIALNIGQTINPNAKGLLASWISQTSTLREALTTFIKHIALMNPSEIWQLSEEKGICTLAFEIKQNKGYPQIAIERSMSAMIAWGQLLSGEKLTILQSSFCFSQPVYVMAYKTIFGEHITFDAHQNCFKFSCHELDLPVISSNALLKDMVENKAKQALKALSPDASTPEKVNMLIKAFINRQQPINVSIVSDALAMSRQTLYRELKKHGTDFQTLFENIRKEQALTLLKSGTESIDTISLKLGYKDNSSFYKAFKRWYGQSPAAFKHSKRI